MSKVRVFSLSLLPLLFVLGAVVAAGATVYEVPGDYATIQQAVTAAGSGDTIVVLPGTYSENIIVNTDHLTVESQSGAEATIVQAADPTDRVFYVTADSVTIEGFAIEGGLKGIRLDNTQDCNISENSISGNSADGIRLWSSSNNTLTNNTASGNGSGIFLENSSNGNTLTGNTVSSNNFGIVLNFSSNNTLEGNTASDNFLNGISLWEACNGNILTGNTASSNEWSGISVGPSRLDNLDALPSNENILDGNTASYNAHNGIDLNFSFANTVTANIVSGNGGAETEEPAGIGIGLWWGSSNNTISNNTVSGNLSTGIVLGIAIDFELPGWVGPDGNELTGNTVSDNSGNGISLGDSSNNIITYNTVSGNSGSGIELKSSSSNEIYLNSFINNGQNAFSDGSLAHNSWNSPDPMNYSYAGSPSASDLDGNGIGDTSYNIGLEEDGYPLMQPFENYIDPSSGPYTSYLGNYWSDYVGPAADISAAIDLKPDTLNLGSKGEWITCYIELPGDHDVNTIDVATVKLNGVVPAEAKPIEIGDYDGDGIADLMVKFDRSSVEEILEVGDEVEVIVTGELADGTSFEGTDTIRVIDEGNKAGQEISQDTFGLSQNYPNPFNPTTTIEYSIAEDSHVTLKIYNLSGQLVKTLVYEYQTPGHYAITWYGDNDTGQEVASGVYFYHFKAGDFVSTKKMVVLK